MTEKIIKKRPADCIDWYNACQLNEQGIGFTNGSISVKPSIVTLEMGHTTVKIPMSLFRKFAEWYLDEQEFTSEEATKRIKEKFNT